MAQTALAAAAAWGLAGLLHERPFFAAVAAVIALGVGRGQRTRRAIELSAGVALGIVVADTVVALLGSGVAVVGLVVALTMLAALALGASDALVGQAGVSAAIVVTIERPDGFAPARAIDALIGVAVALLVGQVLLRRDPVRAMAEAGAPVAEELAAALRECAAALRGEDEALARSALERARAVDDRLAAFEDTVVAARETLGGREQAPAYANAAEQIGFATRNVRVLARRAVATTRRGAPAPGVVVAIERLAEALEAEARELAGAPPGDVRRLATEAATLATAVLAEPQGLQTTVLVGQVRSTAVDLLRGAGLEEEQAVAMIDSAPPG